MEIKHLIVGEQKYLKFTITDKDTKLPLNLTGCSFELKMVNGITTITKTDIDFDKTSVTLGIVKVLLTSANLSITGQFVCQLKTTFPNTEIDYSEEFNIFVNDQII
jgi:hypothetical protein